MKITINFDMDGTIADLYGVADWLKFLQESNTLPYEIAKPMLRFSALAKRLNALQKNGYNLAIISWTSKSGTAEYNAEIAQAKMEWLNRHLPSVHWDEIHIVPYGTPKQMFAHHAQDILFDDEIQNRENWTGRAFDVENIMEILREI